MPISYYRWNNQNARLSDIPIPSAYLQMLMNCCHGTAAAEMRFPSRIPGHGFIIAATTARKLRKNLEAGNVALQSWGLNRELWIQIKALSRMCITATNPSDHWSNKKDVMVLPQAFCSGPRALPYPVAPCKEVARRSPRLSVPLARSEDPLGAPPPGDMGNRWQQVAFCLKGKQLNGIRQPLALLLCRCPMLPS